MERGSSRATASNAKVVQLVDMLFPGKTKQEIAEGLGLSYSSLTQMYSGRHPTSRLVDNACEGIIRRFGKEQASGMRLVVARVSLQHWPTISLLVKDLQGQIVDEFQALVTSVERACDDAQVVILSLDARHEPAVSQLIRSTGGEVRKVLP